MTADPPRLAPLEPPFDEATSRALEPLGPPLALFRLFVRRPERAAGIVGWGHYYLSKQTALTLRHRELVIDRTTARCGAEYEWGIHIAFFAAKVGLDDAQVSSLVHGGPGDACWTEAADRAVLSAVDALHERNDLTDAEFQALVAAVGEEAAIDLMLLCGWYHSISYVARAARLPLEPGTPTFASVRP